MANRGHVELLKTKFDQRSLRGRLALGQSYKDSYPALYKLVQENYEEMVLQEFRMPPLLVAHPKPLENDKPAPFSVKRRSESGESCVKRRSGMVCDSC